MPSPRELLDLWNAAPDRQRWQRILDRAVADDDDATAEVARGALAEVDASALDSLPANARIVRLLTGWRWFVMQQAREEGASWAEIGDALGMSRQSAWEWYKRQIEVQEQHVADLHDADPSRRPVMRPVARAGPSVDGGLRGR